MPRRNESLPTVAHAYCIKQKSNKKYYHIWSEEQLEVSLENGRIKEGDLVQIAIFK